MPKLWTCNSMSENVPKTLKTHFWRCHGNFSRSGIYLSVHDMINDVAASLSIFLLFYAINIAANVFRVKSVRIFILSWPERLKRPSDFQIFPTIFRRFLNFAEDVWRCSDYLWALLNLFKRRPFLCVVILFVHKVNIKHFLEHLQGNWIELSL